jgi:DNA-binding NtrC family response regulator
LLVEGVFRPFSVIFYEIGVPLSKKSTHKLKNSPMIDAKVIVIDDNAAVLKTMGMVLKGAFTKVVTVEDPQLIPALIATGDVDAVVLDMNFGAGKLDGKDGLFWLERIKQRSGLERLPAVVLITAFGDVPLAVDSLKQGADDFVQKPWNNERLIQTLTAAIEKRRAAMARKTEEKATDDMSVARSYIRSLVKRYASTYFRPEPEVTDEAMTLLLAMAIDGEFGRLEETIERTMLLSPCTVWTGEVIVPAEKDSKRSTLTLEEMELQFIRTAWDDSDHNLTSVAQRLGVSRQTLYNKMKKHGIIH